MKKMRVLSSLLATALCITGISITPDTAYAAKKPVIAKKASIEVGKKTTIKVKNATKKTSVKWTVTKKSVAKITKSVNKGKNASATVKGIKKGSTVVKATIKIGKKKTTAKCTVTVKDYAPSSTTAPVVTATPVVPTVEPSVAPTIKPITEPTAEPTAQPTAQPTTEPTAQPTTEPTAQPTTESTAQPTTEPSPEATEYKGTFVCDEHAKITTYTTQDIADAGKAENQTEAIARDSVTGEALSDGNGQINFTVVVDEGYMVDSIVVTPEGSYKNIKGPVDTGKDNTYRVTKISDNVTITVTTKEIPAVPVTEYKATFVCGEHASITTYKTQNYEDITGIAENQTEAIARNSATGEALVDGTGQINFKVVCEEGYRVASVEVTPKSSYKNLKDSSDPAEGIPENTFRVTKITGDLTIAVTIEAIAE